MLKVDKVICMLQARRAIDNYGVHAVIANILETRKERVYVVEGSTGGEASVKTLVRKQADDFIENDIVGHIVTAHAKYWLASC